MNQLAANLADEFLRLLLEDIRKSPVHFEQSGMAIQNADPIRNGIKGSAPFFGCLP